MRIHDLSIRAKAAITVLGALIVSLGIATTFSLRYFEKEQFELTSGHALAVAASTRASVEAALAHGQVREAHAELQALVTRPPIEAFRVVARDGTILLSSSRGEEGARRAGNALPDPWDISPEGEVLGGRAASELSVIVPLSNVGGPGGRATLELVLGASRVEQSIRRGRTFGITLTILLTLSYAVTLGAMLEREIVGPFRRMESLAASQQKLLAEREGFAEVGALASEMAHEIKRPLAGIRGAIELIGQEYAMNPSEQRLLAQVEGSLAHVDETLRDLLSLARPVGLEMRALSVPQLLDGALARLSGHPGYDRVTVERAYDPAAATMRGDAMRLEQAVGNLCVNAIEAMPGGGRLRVATTQRDDLLEIAVSDSGVGIPPEIRDGVLKPFFSTKLNGTGLGLPLVARVVAAHGGRMAFDSEPGRGTTFRLEFPTRV